MTSGHSDPRLLRVSALGEVKSLGPAGPTSILITSGSRSLTVPVEIVAGPAHRFGAVEGTENAIVAGMPSRCSSVKLMDSFDNPVANSQVVFEAAIEPPISLSTATDSNGVATGMLPVITESGHFALSVHTSGSPQISFSRDVRVDAAAPKRLEAVKVLASGPVALVADFELVLRVRDAFGNPVPNVLVAWRTDSGSESFNPQQSLSGPDGLVRTRWQLSGVKTAPREPESFRREKRNDPLRDMGCARALVKTGSWPAGHRFANLAPLEFYSFSLRAIVHSLPDLRNS